MDLQNKKTDLSGLNWDENTPCNPVDTSGESNFKPKICNIEILRQRISDFDHLIK